MVNRVLMGRHPDLATPGLWVSKPGVDARTSTDPEGFLFDPSKYLNRPYVKVTVGAFTRGVFRSTVTFAGGTKADRYDWSADFLHGLGYVPLYAVQAGTDIGEAWADAAKIALPLSDPVGQGVEMFSYNATDTSKTPIAGTIRSGYNVSTQTYTPSGSHSIVSVYRIPLF